jgi:hypothetical protein
MTRFLFVVLFVILLVRPVSAEPVYGTCEVSSDASVILMSWMPLPGQEMSTEWCGCQFLEGEGTDPILDRFLVQCTFLGCDASEMEYRSGSPRIFKVW